MTTNAKNDEFIVWLLEQAGRDDPIGDLASDMQDVSPVLSTLSELKDSMRSKNACREAWRALDEAIAEYSNH